MLLVEINIQLYDIHQWEHNVTLRSAWGLILTIRDIQRHYNGVTPFHHSSLKLAATQAATTSTCWSLSISKSHFFVPATSTSGADGGEKTPEHGSLGPMLGWFLSLTRRASGGASLAFSGRGADGRELRLDASRPDVVGDVSRERELDGSARDKLASERVTISPSACRSTGGGCTPS